MRKDRPYTYLGTTQGMCRQCRVLVPCRVLEDGGHVYQERLCPTCGTARVMIAESIAWYAESARTLVHCKPARAPGTPVQHGCPHDCGPCAFHRNACHLPVFSVTNVCDMACPICFTYNRPETPYFMSRAELRQILDGVLARAGPVDLVNVTGGEPLLHPQIDELLAECRRPGIGRVTVNSNGLQLAENEDLCRRLADLGVYVILSFHTLRPDISQRIHGRDVTAAKLRALENLQRFGVGTTLLHVMIGGVNEPEIGDIIRLAKTHAVVRSVTVQTMTYTGQGGGLFQPREHVPLDRAARLVEESTAAELRRTDFFPHPSAHPLCYSVAYYLKNGGPYRSFTDFLSRDQLRDLLTGGYLLQPGESMRHEFKLALDRLWAEGGDPSLLRQLKALLGRLYPPNQTLSAFERQRIAEESLLTVYLHAHMDEDTLDLARLAVCPDQVPDSTGRLIPACAYNIFYRQQDARFFAPAAATNSRVECAGC
jgi:7,8-dihydro-6-hydroxymethylpterin dimethyltransferase